LMVPTPVTDVPPALVAMRLKVSPLSAMLSLVIATRTATLVLPAGICTGLPV